jgi:NAD(P)-dependent dehydrogenase (short-subunit alcohol dehydrogenase family)
MELLGKVALLTGGARIGSTVAETLAERGCRVALTYRSSRRAALETLRRVRARGVDGEVVRTDVRRFRDLERVVARVARRFGRLDILVNMASLYERAPLSSLKGKAAGRALDRSLGVDLRCAYDLSLLAAPHMQKGGGRIVHFTDWVAASGRPRYAGYIPYYTVKSAVKGVTEALALELAPRVLVNAVAPGPILPPAGLSNAADRDVRANTPLGRWGGPKEIAKAVLFFIESDFVTGETLRVDGGRHLF